MYPLYNPSLVNAPLHTPETTNSMSNDTDTANCASVQESRPNTVNRIPLHFPAHLNNSPHSWFEFSPSFAPFFFSLRPRRQASGHPRGGARRQMRDARAVQAPRRSRRSRACMQRVSILVKSSVPVSLSTESLGQSHASHQHLRHASTACNGAGMGSNNNIQFFGLTSL